MKKILLLIIISIGFNFTVEAQVLIGNNRATANANLEIVTTSNDVASGILIPRTTVAYLNLYSSLYTASSDTDGILIFVTGDINITQTVGTTSLITGNGFYYFDYSQSKWISIDASNYGNGSFIPTVLNIPIAAGQTWDGWSSIDYTNYNYFQFTGTGTTTSSIALPLPTLFSNRTIYIRNNAAGTITYSNYSTYFNSNNPSYNFTKIPNTATHQFYSDGTNWYLMGGYGSLK